MTLQERIDVAGRMFGDDKLAADYAAEIERLTQQLAVAKSALIKYSARPLEEVEQAFYDDVAEIALTKIDPNWYDALSSRTPTKPSFQETTVEPAKNLIRILNGELPLEPDDAPTETQYVTHDGCDGVQTRVTPTEKETE